MIVKKSILPLVVEFWIKLWCYKYSKMYCHKWLVVNNWNSSKQLKLKRRTSWHKYSKGSIKCPLLLNDLVWFFHKVSIKRPGPSQKKSILLFHCRATTANLWALLNHLVWIFGKKSLLNDQYCLFSNSSRLEQPGLMILTLDREIRVHNRIQNKRKFIFRLFFTPLNQPSVLSSVPQRATASCLVVRELLRSFS